MSESKLVPPSKFTAINYTNGNKSSENKSLLTPSNFNKNKGAEKIQKVQQKQLKPTSTINQRNDKWLKLSESDKIQDKTNSTIISKNVAISGEKTTQCDKSDDIDFAGKKSHHYLLASMLVKSNTKFLSQTNNKVANNQEIGISSESRKCIALDKECINADALIPISDQKSADILLKTNKAIQTLHSDETQQILQSFNDLKKENEILISEISNLNMIKKSIENDLKITKSEKQLIKDKLEQTEREQFTEIKSVYNKYISIQNQQDIDKRELQNSIQELGNKLLAKEQSLLEQSKTLEEKQLELNSLHINIDTFKQENKIFVNKMKEKISWLEENDGIVKKEKEELQLKILENEKSMLKMREEIEESSALIKARDKQIIESEEKFKKVVAKNEEKYKDATNELTSLKNAFESFSDEKNALSDELHIKNAEVISLHGKLADQIQQISQLKSRVETLEVLEANVPQQFETITSLHSTCSSLQSANKLLNIQIASLNEVLKVQDRNFTVDSSETKLLNLWRNKVYSLLVQLKLSEIS